MSTFKAYFRKEVIEGVRQYKYIALATGIILFSILDPLMLKLLPTLLHDKMPANLINTFFVFQPKEAIRNYMKDLFQIGTLFVVFTVAGSINEEIYSYRIVFPYSKGANPAGIVLAKLTHYALVMCLFLLVGFSLNYYYANTLFKGQKIGFSILTLIYFLFCLYYLFVISLTLLFSSITKKNIIAGFLSIIVNYSTVIFSQFKLFNKFTPYNLIQLANNFNLKDGKITIWFVILLCGTFIVITIRKINNVELN